MVILERNTNHGMWHKRLWLQGLSGDVIAGLLFLVMTLQSIFFRAPTPSNASSANSAAQIQQTKGPPNTQE